MLRLRVVLVLYLYLCSTYLLKAEEDGTIATSRAVLQERISTLEVDGLADEATILSLQEAYEELLHRPLGLNTASLQEILTLPFISEYQAYQFILYRTRNGGIIHGKHELKEIPGWDKEAVSLYYPLCKLEAPELKDSELARILRSGRSTFALLASYPLADRRSTHYIGTPLSTSLRYKWHNSQHISIALGADKDSYEPWAYHGHRGFDSYHGHIALRNLGIVNQVVLGQFRTSWAEGLLLNQGFSIRSLMSAMPRTAIRPATGVSEQGISQGVAIELAPLKRLRFSMMGSLRHIDGAVDDATDLVTALSNSGLHRTERDWARRYKVPERYLGARLALEFNSFELAIQALHYDWGGLILKSPPGVSLDSKLNHIDRHANASLSYSYTPGRARWSIAGELATSASGGLAMLHRVRWSMILGEWQALVRYITPTYWAYYGQSKTHARYPNNESGIGLMYTSPNRNRGLRMTIEADAYQRLREQGDDPYERGAILRTRADYIFSDKWVLNARLTYRHQSKLQSSRNTISFEYKTQKLRAQLLWLMAQTIRNDQIPWAYGLGLKAKYVEPDKWQTFGSLVYYHAPDWENRLYFGEPRLSLQYGIPSLYGEGVRLMLGGSCTVARGISLGLRALYEYNNGARPNRGELALQLIYRPW